MKIKIIASINTARGANRTLKLLKSYVKLKYGTLVVGLIYNLYCLEAPYIYLY